MSTMNTITDILKLKSVQQSLEKNETNLVEHINNFAPEYNIKEIYNELNMNRTKEIERVQKDALSVWLPLQKLKSNSFSDNIEDTDVDALKRQMNLMQINLKALKQQITSHLLNLVEEETELMEDVMNYERIIENVQSFSKIAPNNINVNAKHISYKTTNFATPEIQEYIDFVALSGGHENRWNIQDHQLFLKTRKKYKDTKTFVKAFHSILPNIPEEDILEHEKWYCTYIDLRDKQKNAIEKWKHDREAINNFSKKFSVSECDITSNNKRNGVTFESNPEIEEKLQNWKREKEEKCKREQQLKMENETRKIEKEKLKQSRQREIKESVQQWKNSKTAKLRNEKIEKELVTLKEKEMRSAQANKLLKQFRSNDDFYIQKMKRCRESQQGKYKSECNLRKEKITVPRDPGRLLKPTKQWISRFMATRNSKEDKYSFLNQGCCSVTDIPKLGVPNWIQNKAAY